jgi:hypothetical protein
MNEWNQWLRRLSMATLAAALITVARSQTVQAMECTQYPDFYNVPTEDQYACDYSGSANDICYGTCIWDGGLGNCWNFGVPYICTQAGPYEIAYLVCECYW